ncbi:MAG: glycosyltransferase [Solirubrobacteraceae bacterium]
MKILHVYKDVYPPVAGGIERHIHSIRLAVPSREHDVLVCSRTRRTTYQSPGPEVSGQEVLVGQLGRIWSTPIAPAFPGWLRRMARGALVHLHMPNPLSELSSLLLAPGTPTVASYHCDIFRQRALMPLYRPLLLWCLSGAHEVVCGSESLRKTSPVLAAVKREITVIPYGIDTDHWAAGRVNPAETESLRRRYGGEYVVAVGRLVSYKGFDGLIDAAAHFSLPLVIVGDGPARPGLEDRINTLGLSGRVFLAGPVSDAELAVHLAAARLFVMSSVNRAESYGIAILEAQAAGLPVVVTDVGTGTSEAFAPGRSGLLVPAESMPALIGAVNRLAGDRDLSRRMGEEGSRRVLARNSLSALGSQIGALYDRAEAAAAAAGGLRAG